MRNEGDVFLSAKSGVETAEGEDESASGIQSSLVSRWERSKSVYGLISHVQNWSQSSYMGQKEKDNI